MKKLILISLTLLMCLSMHAQTSNLILFCQEGQPFYAVLNGLRMNEEPVTNLRIDALTMPNYKLKIIFADKNQGEVDKTLLLPDMNIEATFNVKRNKKGEWKVRYVSHVPINQAPPAPPAQRVIHYNPNPQPAQSVVVEEVTTTTHHGHPAEENVNMNVNLDGFGMNVNVSGGGTHATSSVTTTTTTVTSSGGLVGHDEVIVEDPGCAPMLRGDFESAKASINSKSFSDSKMTLAKQITRNNCLTSDQVKQIISLFDFESDRLEYAKFAYAFTYDPNNYYKVNDAFEFESSIEELDEYISGGR